MGEQYLVEPTDLTPVLESLEGLRQSLELTNQQQELTNQWLEQISRQLEQLHADTSLVFLGLVLIVGLILGCALGMVLMRMWGT